MKNRFRWFCFVLSLLLLLNSINVFSATDAPFTDISNSPFKSSIESLYEKGIVTGYGSEFRPQDNLTKAEAATLVSKAFKIADIQAYDYKADETLAKQYAYSGHLGVVTEAFMVAAAKDAKNTWASPYVEGILSAGITEAKDGAFEPFSAISGSDFADMLAKAIYGVNAADHSVQKGVTDGFIDADLATSNEPIKREVAAKAIDNIVSNDNFTIITIFATSDIHGNLVPYTPSGSKALVGSLAKMSYIIEKMRAVQPNFLLLDGGDSPYNTNIANLFEGRSTIDIMNAMKYDATVLGNHDFDFAFQVLLNNAKHANYPFLSVNTFWKDGNYPEEFKKSIVKEVGGLQVGIVGATDDTSDKYTHYANTQDIMFKDQYETTKEEVEQLKDKTDLMIVLSHLHGGNPILPTKVDGIDIEIGGGNDLMGQPIVIDDTWLINPGKHAECINQINVNMLNKEKIGVVFSQIVLNPDMPENTVVTEIAESYAKQLDDKMKNVVGATTVNLDGERATVRLKESNLANAIADSLKDYFEADIALQNGGGVRASIDEGDITMGEVYATLPFDNRLILIEATGKTIWETLENGVAVYPSAAGQFLQVSGISYTFDAAKPVGERIVSVTIGDKDLDLEQTYKVVINDFMAGGGDGYSMIKCLGANTEEYSDVKLLKETNDFLRDVFTAYLVKNQTIAPTTEGRITIINEAAPQ